MEQPRVKCQAVLNVQYRCKVPMRQCCQQSAAQVFRGVGLCVQHINAATRGPLQVFVAFDQLEDAELAESVAVPQAVAHSGLARAAR